tara:strand:- start:4189 stop:4560 length:372 start_codon:yes stop_codon:yes gene_type:complete
VRRRRSFLPWFLTLTLVFFSAALAGLSGWFELTSFCQLFQLFLLRIKQVTNNFLNIARLVVNALRRDPVVAGGIESGGAAKNVDLKILHARIKIIHELTQERGFSGAANAVNDADKMVIRKMI